jgi:NCAIR mutase (PurE)-related protein
VSAGGKVALEAALASCAPGLVVVNVDNGFGAALAAIKMLGLGSSAGVRLDQAETSHR